MKAPVLVVGLGSAGQRHARNLKRLGCEEVVGLRTFQGHLPVPDTLKISTVSSWEEALACRPRAAVIANPTALHLPTAHRLAEAGCHLFIEKPIGSDSDLESGRALEVLVRKRNLVVMVGCQFRFHPLLRSMRQQLHAGRVGRIIGARAEWGEHLPAWHPWEDHRESYSAREDLGGGTLLTLIHPIDYLLWIFGRARRVQAAFRSVPCLETRVPDDWAELILHFENDVLAHVHLDFLQRPRRHALTVWGEAGQVVFDEHAMTLVWRSVEGEVTREQPPAGFERNTAFIDEMRHFLARVEDRGPTAIPIGDGLAALEIVRRARIAATAN